MGIVYEAEQESLGRRVAIKVLPFHSLLGAKHLERFRQEARAAARLTHSNIVPVFGVGEHFGLHYFVMQYIPGKGLDAVVEEVRRLRKDGRDAANGGIAGGGIASDLSTGSRQRYHQNIARIVRDAGLALDHAHREGILHRDVKPSNLPDPTGHVWLADFGLSKASSDDLTHSGISGTFRYMAPERFAAERPRSDVLLGLTLYELLALRPAFVESDGGRSRQVASEEPPLCAASTRDPARPRDHSPQGDRQRAHPALRHGAGDGAGPRPLPARRVGEARRSTADALPAGARQPRPRRSRSAVLLLLLACRILIALGVELARARLGPRGARARTSRRLDSRLSHQPGQLRLP
jgi:serine/threonine protein kinase